jgi:hypothetical protein
MVGAGGMQMEPTAVLPWLLGLAEAAIALALLLILLSIGARRRDDGGD